LSDHSCNHAALVRTIIVEAMRDSFKSRAEIADEISDITEVRVTERMLNAFAADSREDHRFPCELLIAFCTATNDYSLLKALVEGAGFKMIGPDEQKALRVGQAYLRKLEAERVLAEVQP
jgi:hypothetical protein